VLSELQGLQNKLIAYISGTPASSKVYGLPTIGTTGISQVKQEKNVKIFPNPTSDFIFITNDFDTKIDNIKIYNTEGKCLLELHNYNNQPINISDLNRGIYFITGLSKNDVLLQSKFVIN
jgi:hypothetical protein